MNEYVCWMDGDGEEAGERLFHYDFLALAAVFVRQRHRESGCDEERDYRIFVRNVTTGKVKPMVVSARRGWEFPVTNVGITA